MAKDKDSNQSTGSPLNPDNPKKDFKSPEKAALGGRYNSGVTSSDPDEKEQIEKQGSMGKKQPAGDNDKQKENG